MDLYNKISLNPGSSIIFPQNNHYTTNATFNSKRDPALFDKLHNEKLGKIHLKIKEESIVQIIEEEKELTFHPKVRNPFNLKRRSVDEFIQDMDDYQKFKEENRLIQVIEEYEKQESNKNTLFK